MSYGCYNCKPFKQSSYVQDWQRSLFEEPVCAS